MVFCQLIRMVKIQTEILIDAPLGEVFDRLHKSRIYKTVMA